MPSHSHDLHIEPLDLSEAPPMIKESYPKGMMFGAAFLGLMFVGLLIHASLPELSPSEIVAMDGYSGERPTKHIFNLQGLKDDAAATAVAIEKASTEKLAAEEVAIESVVTQEPVSPIAAPITASKLEVVEAPSQAPSQAKVTEPEEIVRQATVTQEVVNSATQAEVAATKPLIVPEIVSPVELPIAETTPVPKATPVIVTKLAAKPEVESSVAFESSNVEKIVADVPSVPAVDEVSTTIVIASIVADAPAAMPIRRDSQVAAKATEQSGASAKDEEGRLLPLRIVLQNSTEMKQTPSEQAETVMSLGKGVVVTAFETIGDWVHIGTNDGKSVTGYVRGSDIGAE